MTTFPRLSYTFSASPIKISAPENALKLVVRVAPLCECSPNHWIVHLKRMNMLCEWYSNKAVVEKTKGSGSCILFFEKFYHETNRSVGLGSPGWVWEWLPPPWVPWSVVGLWTVLCGAVPMSGLCQWMAFSCQPSPCRHPDRGQAPEGQGEALRWCRPARWVGPGQFGGPALQMETVLDRWHRWHWDTWACLILSHSSSYGCSSG